MQQKVKPDAAGPTRQVSTLKNIKALSRGRLFEVGEGLCYC